ncbi:hypothetical protein [Halalkalibaculum sp. DA384]|uniref:hypothetical protein n=1 Tax=Halalkalibaculum sp. DA384 TaxID=3373606 RepID=UPI00375521CC
MRELGLKANWKQFSLSALVKTLEGGGAFRIWRDLGYATGALLADAIADMQFIGCDFICRDADVIINTLYFKGTFAERGIEGFAKSSKRT